MAKNQVWKALLEQHDKLKKVASATLYDRVTLLAKVYEDPEYLADVRKTGKSPVEALDSRVSDTCANFTELLQMLRMFPTRKAWESGDLAAMRIKMLESLRVQQQARNGTGKKGKKKERSGTRQTATLHQVREMEVEVERKKTEVDHLKELIAEKDKAIEELRDKVSLLRETLGAKDEKIASLQLRINQLQQTASN